MKISLHAEETCKIRKIKRGTTNGRTYLLVTMNQGGEKICVFADPELEALLQECVDTGTDVYPQFDYTQWYNSKKAEGHQSLRLVNLLFT
jgi:hypothetical protein